jgi:eukaryotic-like serine/threonine-protein kinase
MTSQTSVKPGDVLAGKYRVERVLGAGGMGYVVAARHLQLDQLVAMKFLRRGAVENAEAGTRFLREAKAVVKLRNEHIAKVFDVGTMDGGEPYIVMEYLDGCDLAALAKQRHAIPVPEACEYVMQACEALAEAHTLGIIHRDIKLANLFITRGPAGGPLVKVLDFGISKTNPFGESEHDMTRTASMLGSPRFMSPEQMRDPRAVDGRSDIWSLGVVLYRLIGGRPPFEADTLGRLLTMVMHEQEAPLSSVRRDLPPGFDQVVGQALQKDPATRYANVAELAYALVPYCADPAHARAAADRIAAVLSMPVTPSTGDVLVPVALSSGRLSMPPGASDTGTAAPWAGTHGGSRMASSRSTTIWLGVALASLLVGSGVFAMVRRDHGTPAQGVFTEPQPSEMSPQQMPTPTSLSDPRAPAPPVLTAPTGYIPADARGETMGAGVQTVPTILGASPVAPSAPNTATARVEPTPRRAAPPPPPPPPRGKNAGRPADPGQPAARPAKNEDGIPTTRD